LLGDAYEHKAEQYTGDALAIFCLALLNCPFSTPRGWVYREKVLHHQCGRFIAFASYNR
jgi:hypothetical protein